MQKLSSNKLPTTRQVIFQLARILLNEYMTLTVITQKNDRENINMNQITQNNNKKSPTNIKELKKPNQPQHLPVFGILPYSLVATYGSCLTGP